MLRAAAPLVVLVLLAGCLGGAEPEATTAGASSSTAQEGAADASQASATLTPTENATDASAVIPVATPIAYSGHTPTGVCQFMVGQCLDAQQGTEDFHMLDPVAGQATLLALQVTYGEQAPGMEFYVGVCSGPDEGTQCTDYQTGPSPLVVEFDLSAYPPGTSFGISVGSLNTAAMQTATMVFAPVDFEVAGTLTSLPAA